MTEHNQKFTANSEADQLWKDFEYRLDNANEENLLYAWDDDLVSVAATREKIQCLNYKALGDIMGKVQVLQGQIQLLQLEQETPQVELQRLHAQLQVLCGRMLPYLATRIKQAPGGLLKKAITTYRIGSSGHVQAEGREAGSVDVVQEGSTRSTNETDQNQDTTSDTSPIETPASDADSSAGSVTTARGGGIRRRK
jgi:hypothetical protein